MAKDPFEQFAMPKELRAFVEQSVAQARNMPSTASSRRPIRPWGSCDGQAQAAHGGANEIAHKSMEYAEQNVAATFEFAEKLMRAKDADRGHGAAIGVPRPADAGAFSPGPGAWTKRCQNGGGCC